MTSAGVDDCRSACEAEGYVNFGFDCVDHRSQCVCAPDPMSFGYAGVVELHYCATANPGDSAGLCPGPFAINATIGLYAAGSKFFASLYSTTPTNPPLTAALARAEESDLDSTNTAAAAAARSLQHAKAGALASIDGAWRVHEPAA